MRNFRSFRHYLAMLCLYLKPQWFQVLLVIVTLLVVSGQQLVVPQLIRTFIDTTAHGGKPLFLLVLALCTIGVTVIGQAFSVISTYFSTKVAWLVTNEMRGDLMKHCLSLDIGFHKSHPPGELIERIDGDLTQISKFIAKFMFTILQHSIVLVAVLILLSLVAWFIGVTITLFVIIAFIVLTALRRWTVPLWEQNRQTNADLSSFLGERLAGIEDIRANGAVSYTMYRFLGLLRQRWFATLRSERLSQIQSMSLISLLSCALLVVLVQGTYLWSIHLATLGTVYLIFSYTLQLIAPIAQLHNQFQNIQQVEACMKRTSQLLTTIPAQQDGPGCSFPPGPLSISFDRVTFGYLAKEPVLHEITFQLQAGKVLGLLGRTGSGKTTIASLLFRFYDPQEGEISIDGKPLRQAKLHDLRRSLGMVTQSVQLFRASVRDNLTFFNRDISDERILDVLDDVGLHSWYHRLPAGLDTLLGSEGEGLSAGEAQLLAFTRIFLSEPGVVILDEASSHLDPATEALLERAMDKLLSYRTAIIITHSLRTIQRADNILLLEGGSIQEYGAREALAQDPTSRFNHLLQAGLEEVLT